MVVVGVGGHRQGGEAVAEGLLWKMVCNRLLSYPIIAARISKINNEPARS